MSAFKGLYAFQLSALGVLLLLASAHGHGVITKPKPRAIGAANQAACGEGVYGVLKKDDHGPIESAAAKTDSGYNATACHLFFCRGLQFDDNKSNVQTYKAGQVVPFHVDIAAHHTGYANVSIFNLATQEPIGAPLVSWSVYANDTLGPSEWPPNESDFNVTIPSNLGTTCSKAGQCAIQWWWYGYNKQTYESCVDFVVA
ncbi:hypothetical protein BDN72DRAFT_846617 [Pluteus cervinus]|uniref:Uncharacterized protein n=1 Tax=Pluteus cervinus TaxID=181527 RepID=A0ACD3AFN3_9AGAR|nr:hypothetical protein BDN72DRAFT_846617 [Pluteus cervinus]